MTTKLLAVDDSKTMRKVLEITFAGNKYDSKVVGSAEEALASLRSNPPQLVVVDGHLGGTSGYDLCQQIKSVAPQVKVVLLSSKQRPFDAAKAAAVGVDDHFDKPFDSTKFLDKLDQIDLNAASASTAAPVSAAASGSTGATPAAQPAIPQPTISKPITSMPVAVKPVVAQPVAAVPVSVTPLGSRPAAPPLSPAAGPAIAQSRPAAAPDLGALKSSPSPVVSKPIAQSPTAAQSPIAAQSSTAASSSTAALSSAAASSRSVAPSAAAAALNGNMSAQLSQLGLTADQIQGVLALSREVVEQVVWEVVPHLAETLIKEEIARLTAE